MFRSRACGSTEWEAEEELTDAVAKIDGCLESTDYEFQVCRCGLEPGMSDIRLGRTGFVPGTVVNYLHPEDDIYAFSGRALCSPSLVRTKSGKLLASMDVFEGGGAQNLSLIFKSTDDGSTWSYVTDLFPCFWGKLFLHRGALYMLATSTEYGDLLIGRLATAIEYGSWRQGGHASAMLSIAESDDLMVAENWICTEFLPYDARWPGAVEGVASYLEGNAVVSPEGNLCNMLRYQIAGAEPNHGKSIILEADAQDFDGPLRFHRVIDFEGGSNSKFDVMRDDSTGHHLAIVNEVVNASTPAQRNVLSLAISPTVCERPSTAPQTSMTPTTLHSTSSRTSDDT